LGKGKTAASPGGQEDESEVDQRTRELNEKAKLHAAEEAAEEQAVMGTDRVESVVCELFYIRYICSGGAVIEHGLTLNLVACFLQQLQMTGNTTLHCRPGSRPSTCSIFP
jgi:hypothetical protein